MTNPLHKNILRLIIQHAGKPTRHTDLDSYLGSSHPRYPISMPVLRKIAKEWMREHQSLSAREISDLLTSLMEGDSFTEKCMAGILLDYASAEQCLFDVSLFDHWLDHVEGWAEVDVLCTGAYTKRHIILQWKKWKPLLNKFSKDKNIHKRRASLALLVIPVRYHEDKELAEMAFKNIDRLKNEKEILITKAISWLLRSMIKLNRSAVEEYVENNRTSLPAIAVRETLVKLKTGKKNHRKTRGQ